MRKVVNSSIAHFLFKRGFLACWLYIVFEMSCGGQVHAQTLQDNPDPSAALKKFISSPPPFEMIAEICNRTPESTNDETSCEYALLRFQSNGFYYRGAPTFEDLNSQRSFFPKYRWAGRFDEEYWDFGSLTLSMGTNHESRTREVVELVEAIHASKLLHLGIFGSLPGSVQWNGNKILPFTNRFGVAIQGELVIGVNSLPQKLKLMTSREGNHVPWEIVYEFSMTQSLPQYLPAKISGWSLFPDHRELSFEIRLISASISAEPLAKEYFMPGAATNRVPHQILSTSSGALFRDKLHPKWTSVPIPTQNNPMPRTMVRLIFAFANIVLLSALIVYSWRKRAANKPQSRP